jgi:hypothetical protein
MPSSIALKAILGTKALLGGGKAPAKKMANPDQWAKDKRAKKQAKKAKKKNRNK